MSKPRERCFDHNWITWCRPGSLEILGHLSIQEDGIHVITEDDQLRGVIGPSLSAQLGRHLVACFPEEPSTKCSFCKAEVGGKQRLFAWGAGIPPVCALRYEGYSYSTLGESAVVCSSCAPTVANSIAKDLGLSEFEWELRREVVLASGSKSQ